MKTAPPSKQGFTLVEIALAIGVAAVALVTIIGLLGGALESNHSAGRDTTLVAMTTHVMSDLRSAPSFESLWFEKPREKGFVKKPNGVPSAVPADTSYYFTEDGQPVTGTNPKSDLSVIYECTVKKTPDMPRVNENKGPSNLLKLQLVFTSPVSANPSLPDKRPHRRIINASIARF